MKKKELEFLKVLHDVLKGYDFSPIIAQALRFFFRNPYESLVIVNREGKLEFMDRGSEKFLGLPEGGAKGIQITDLIPDSGLPGALDTGTPSLGRLFNIKGTRRIGSTYPLIKNGEIVGAIGRLIFRSFEEVERISKEMRRLEREVKSLRARQRYQYRALYTFENIMGISPAITEAIEMAKKVASIDTDVLIAGESGTGKELFAQAIHNFINPERPFIGVNSPAIPFELAESEFFGYEKGAFSGASITGKAGKFELAHNGTIFLDEISSLPLSIQAKLLRVLQEKEIERLGGTRTQKVNFRLIVASNADLRKLVGEGKFREDLYYRIAKAAISIPPLRERVEDIPVYISYFLKTINERFGTNFKGFSHEALECLMHYDWPGNIRELINVLEQACLKKWRGEEIPMICLPLEVVNSSSFHSSSFHNHSPAEGFKNKIKEREKDLILEALEKTKGNKRKASFLLGMPRSTLYKKLNDHNIDI
ncbi:MAG: sigma 54-interacting transcriptional regulator [Deltaproteobacteria bacterium]|nr:sigma 54-interacting transcriptional regulator [Deltaproteobacteria bacterium]